MKGLGVDGEGGSSGVIVLRQFWSLINGKAHISLVLLGVCANLSPVPY